ncbi:Beta-ketoacyl synthase [Solidesulfovibrio carbinoliphilus subsp. oakridgensis]|uniref:Beta-ketoacyl synthase n=1 Tax=Solidesulfovibrio carbinoliphilus subsp. oakridgensis TaxID=694327 RepID=G7QBI5_9BACT|nr:beta-ketoacyl synthase N-terminal-like domain-containing protein [Solidesulfovibrio carbinoliphilus]EHJ48848.1 Beta-ketoacyl synthase [Solidesulfovibrio carbinoliphilus subsp. oakridgensis]
MNRLAVSACGIAGPAEAFSGHEAWSGLPGIRAVLGGAEIVTEALRAHYPSLKLRRLDAYAQTALLAAKLAVEACGEAPANLGLVVCTGYGPIPATNAFMDSCLDFGPRGASPTAFSQTVHNLAASTVSMFLGCQGPALSVSQPGLGCSGALLTARSWIVQGLIDTVLFGAVDDCQAFSRFLFPGDGSYKTAGDPVALFAVLTARDGGDRLLDVLDVGFPEPSGARAFVGPYESAPVDVLAGMLSALDPAQGGREVVVEESWDGLAATIRVRSAIPGGRS